MQEKKFSDVVNEIKKYRDWFEVYPQDREINGMKMSVRHLPKIDWDNPGAVEQLVRRDMPRLFSRNAVHYEKAEDVLLTLTTPRLEVAGLFRMVYRFQRDLTKIRQGLLRYGLYLKADRISDRPQKDYQNAVALFLRKIAHADPKAKIEPLRRSLLYVDSRPINIGRRSDMDRIDRFCRRFLSGLRSSRREGRPPNDGNILIYHLVNNLTVYRLKRNGELMKDRRGRIKLERKWDTVARVLIWIHFKKLPLPWVNSFIAKYSRSAAYPAMVRLKKLIQRKYAHLGPPKGQGHSPEGSFHPLGIRRLVLLDDGIFSEHIL